MGNYSKDPDAVLQDALAKGYDGVRFQQGKPILDRELNLLGDLASPRRLAPYIGNGVPTLDGLWADPPPDPSVVNFFLMPGRCMVGGLELLIRDKVGYVEQPHKENLAKAWLYTPVVKFGLGSGDGYVYLRLFLSEADDTADAALGNAGDIGFETSLRRKVDWELLLSPSPINQPDHLALAAYTVKVNTVVDWRDIRVAGLTLEQVRRDLDALIASTTQKTVSLTASGALQPNTVGNANLLDDSVTTSKIQDSAVTTNKLANLAVGNAKLADGSVTTTKLAALSVDNTKIANSAVDGSKIAGLSVDGSKLTNGAVDASKILNGAVDANKIGNAVVGSNHLAAGAVTYGKVASAAITVAQIKFSAIASGVTTVAAGGVFSITLLAPAYQGQDNFIVYSLWGNGDFTWSEYFSAGSRLLKVQNNGSTVLTLNYMIRRIQES